MWLIIAQVILTILQWLLKMHKEGRKPSQKERTRLARLKVRVDEIWSVAEDRFGVKIEEADYPD